MAHTDRQPSDKIFDDMVQAAQGAWIVNYDDDYGYVTEKLDRIKAISNYADNWCGLIQMFDSDNQMKFAELLKYQESLDFLRGQREHYSYVLPREKQ